jgi:hypothetical protein
MSGAVSVVCLCSALLVGQRAEQTIHKGPAIEVLRQLDTEGGPPQPSLPYHCLLYHLVRLTSAAGERY